MRSSLIIFLSTPTWSKLKICFTRHLNVSPLSRVKTHTAPYKYPRIVEFVDELPKTISGKIRRVQIRETDKNKS